MNRKRKSEAIVKASIKGSSKKVTIAWFPRKHKEGDVWWIQTTRIVKRKKVAAPLICITDQTIDVLLETIYRMRTLGEFKVKKEKNK